MKPKLCIIITRSEIGGAQKYVLSMIKGLSNVFSIELVTGSDAYLSDAVKKIDCEVTVLPAIDSPNLLRAVYSLRAHLRRSRPSIINTHSSLASFYSRLASFRLMMPVVYSVHGWFFNGETTLLRKSLGAWVERSISGLTTHWITETEHDRDVGLSNKIIPSEKASSVIPNGIEEPITRDFKTSKDETINIVFVGRVSYQKNPELAIKILSELPENYSLTLFCDDANNTKINELKNALSLGSRLDIVDNELDTASVMHSFDLLLVTSRYEGMPLAMIEAMAAGLPIVSSDVCGLNELVKNTENGYLIDSFNPTDYSNAIQSLFENSERIREMGLQSRQFYMNNHQESVMIERLKALFSSLLELEQK